MKRSAAHLNWCPRPRRALHISAGVYIRFRHNDVGHLETCLKTPTHPGRRLVIVDAVFSMDGDVIDLPEVSRLARSCRRLGVYVQAIPHPVDRR